MIPEQIEIIAKRKVQDYLENIIIDLTIRTTKDPERKLKEIESEAFLNCNYDDPTIDKEIYQQLQAAIKQQLQILFENIAKKAEYKFGNL